MATGRAGMLCRSAPVAAVCGSLATRVAVRRPLLRPRIVAAAAGWSGPALRFPGAAGGVRHMAIAAEVDLEAMFTPVTMREKDVATAGEWLRAAAALRSTGIARQRRVGRRTPSDAIPSDETIKMTSRSDAGGCFLRFTCRNDVYRGICPMDFVPIR